MRLPKGLLIFLAPLLLAACVDARVDVDVTGTGTASVAVSQTLSNQIRAMLAVRDEADPAVQHLAAFCQAGTRTIRPDRSLTCTRQVSGHFRQITGRRAGTPRIVFAPLGAGLVRVSIPTAALQEEILGLLPAAENDQGLRPTLFNGRTLTLTIGGGTIAWSNMAVSEDRQEAEQRLALRDLIEDKPGLPREFFAVVRVP